MESLQQWLAALTRFAGGDRLYTLETDALDASQWAVERWQGSESLGPGDGPGYEWRVDLLSVDAHLPLDRMLGKRATLWTLLADGTRQPRSGLISQAQCLGSDGSLARYRLSLVPWTWLLLHGRHSCVHQDRSVVQIVDAVFARYAPWAQWRWSGEVAAFLAQVRPRSYCVQYRETDMAYVSRLLAEEGLGWRFEEDGEGPAGHRVVLFAQSDEGPQDSSAAREGAIRFHRSDATEYADTVQAMGSHRRVGSSELTLLSDDYKRMQTRHANALLDTQADADQRLEAYDPAGPYAFASHDEAQRHAHLIAQVHEARVETGVGRGTVRSFRAGQWFALDGADDFSLPCREWLLTTVHHAGVNNLPPAIRDALTALPGDAEQAASSLAPDAWQAVLSRAQAVGYANAFTALPRARPWRPALQDDTGLRINPRPTAPGYQTAMVVGADDANATHARELHCDRMGRIRVRFHFQQGDAANGASTSCWLRVSQRYAGPGVGSQFLPRIGQEVLVAFLEGDIDRPLVVGTLYNGQGDAGVPPTPGGRAAETSGDTYAQARDDAGSAQGNRSGGHAPAWHGMGAGTERHRNAAALSGFKSREWGGEGHNRLVFDDSDGQLRLQLASTQAATQLNLGHLIHQADNYRGSFRGEGFELRSDAWGAVRAERGLWVSAYSLAQEAPTGEQVAAVALLQQSVQLAQTFSQAAITHLTVPLAAHAGIHPTNASSLDPAKSPLQALLASARATVAATSWEEAHSPSSDTNEAPVGDDHLPHTGAALIGLAAPAGIGLVAGQQLIWSAAETLTLSSGQASNLAIAGDLRLHTGQAIGVLAAAVEGQQETTTLSLAAGEGELDLQSQGDQLRLQSREQLKLVSANAQLEMAAGKTIHLATAGGASLTIEGGNITFACPGAITVHAGKKSFLGPTQLSREMNSWSETKFDEGFELRDPAGDLIRNMPYKLTRADGAIIRGITDADGRIPVQKGLGLERVVIEILQQSDGDMAG